ncbi:hypothetical protein [Methanobrevibacter sp.]|uniref:hypothetical protein n=1 Tax=Methanobrevibacter sp. TaxID=66852 RepID=UPI0025F970B1|nr:hypothetical protein [Methanobrevibacter sp.]MBR4447641.1 hypothetical protein [Methanobrevibacter sp.]
MEQWKQSILVGVFLIILALAFSAARNEMSILMVFVIILGVVDIIFGLYRKKNEKK